MTEEERRRHQVLSVGLAMVLSLWVHILALTLWQFFPPQSRHPTPPPLVLEIERADEQNLRETSPPPLEDLKTEKIRSADQVITAASSAEASTDPGPSLDEETISLESQAPEYLSYLSQVKLRIKSRWIFPPEARDKYESGRLTLVFTLDRTGKLHRIVIESPSGRQLLDQAAVEAVRGADPFPAFPEHINLERLNIRAHFDYRIRVIKVR